MLSHIEETLPSTLHLPISSEDTLHFYWYLCTHVLLANKQFLLLIDVPIQDRSQQLSIYKIFTLDIRHGNFIAHYDINTQYLDITQDEPMTEEISPQQFRICQEANGQFCNIPTPFQPLTNPQSWITALYAKNTASISTRSSLQIKKTLDISMPSQLAPNDWTLTTAPSPVTTTVTLICPGETMKFIDVKKLIHVLQLPTACSAISPNFHLPPCYESPTLEVNISLDMANLKMINISSMNFHIWQHFGAASEWESATTLDQHTLSSSGTTLQPHGQRHSTNYTFHLTWRVIRRYRFHLDTVFSYMSLCNGYRITYTSSIGNILLLFLLVLTCQISTLTFTTRYYTIYNCGWWCRGSTHLQMWWQGLTAYKTLWESWPAYRRNIPTWMESWCKQQMLSLVVPAKESGNTEMHITSVVRLRIAPHTVPYGLMINEPFGWQ